MSSGNQSVKKPMEVEGAHSSQPAGAVSSSQLTTDSTEMMEAGMKKNGAVKPTDQKSADEELTEKLAAYMDNALDEELTKQEKIMEGIHEKIRALQARYSNRSNSAPAVQEEDENHTGNGAELVSNISEVIGIVDDDNTKMDQTQLSLELEPEVNAEVSAASVEDVREIGESQEVVEEESGRTGLSGNNATTGANEISLLRNAGQHQIHHNNDFEMDQVQVQQESEEDIGSDGEGTSTRPSTVKNIPKRIIHNREAKTRTVEQQVKSNAGKKRSAAPKKTPAKRRNYEKLPIYWHTLACFRSKHFLNLDSLKDGEFKSQLIETLQPTEETNLSDTISYKNDKSYEDTERILDGLFKNMPFQKLLIQADRDVSQDQSEKRMAEKKLTTALLLGEKPTCKVPFLLYTFGFKKDVVGKNGREIVEKASEFEIDGQVNPVYNSEEFSYCAESIGPEFPPTNFFASRGFEDLRVDKTGESSSAQSKQQVPVATLDINDDDLERKATSLSVCLIRDAGKRITAEIFTPENLQKICDSNKMVVLRQIGQHSTQNEQPGEQTSNFHVGTVYERKRVKTFFENLREVTEVSEKCVKKCISNGSVSENDLTELQEELKLTELPCKDIRTKISPLIICFGSNIDIDDEEKEVLQKALQGLPAWTRPREGLMAILKDKLPGINRIQVYVKGPGCRTTAHYENEGIGSINVNLGPDDCVWFTISMNYSAQLETLLCKKKVAPCHDPIWLNEEELQGAGIPYSKFLQKPNDMVFVNTGTYHWVQSNGFCTNVSWNILMEDKTQLAAAALSNDYNAMHSFANALPIEKLIWSIAKEKKYPNSEISKLTKQLLTCSLAHITMEQKCAEKEGWVIKDGKNYLEDVNLCTADGCHRNSLFNLFFLKLVKKELMPRCYNCVKIEDQATTTCYIMHTLEELVEIFDAYE
ncbi:hypothetical protein CAEBREN_09167 [Caenorhabditis brenneri]|uniref:JmjC domain-containing protein n=1 Tax=Caenorhabditis brenneri TaxID=135651 RepID=G0MAL6_CAEBE|nr:hypothetical protein CAEBREN_09167 [Caenorhabditis brenneri]